MRISDWSSDVCSSDLGRGLDLARAARKAAPAVGDGVAVGQVGLAEIGRQPVVHHVVGGLRQAVERIPGGRIQGRRRGRRRGRQLLRLELALGLDARAHELEVGPMLRSEEHTSELQSLMRISYAVFCLKTK